MDRHHQHETSSMRVLASGQGEHWLVGGETTTIKVSGRDTDRGLLMLETLVQPGGGPADLYRHRFVEFFRVLQSEFDFTTADASGQKTTLRAEVGDTVHVPSLTWHGYRNVGNTSGVLLTVFACDAIEELAHAIGQRIDDPANPPASAGPPSREGTRRAGEVMVEYEIAPFSVQTP